MAKQTLPTNFLDDILASSMNGKRRYLITQNEDGSYSMEDVTTYDQIGSALGQAILNAITTAINQSADQAKIIDLLSSVAAVTENGYIMGAKAGAELYKNLNTMQSNFQAGCSTIAAAITAMGVSTASNASPATMAANIKKIVSVASGTFSRSSSGNTVTCGFKPSKVVLIDVSSSSPKAILIYDSSYSTTNMVCAYSNAGTRNALLAGGGADYADWSLTLSSTGFKAVIANAYDGDTVYWFAVK